MVIAYFNNPLPCPDPEIRVVRMAMEMQRDVEKLIVGWRKRGIKLGFGIGISSGYATLGRIGSEEEFHVDPEMSRCAQPIYDPC